MSKSISTFGLIAVMVVCLGVAASGLAQTSTTPTDQSSAQSSSASSSQSASSSNPVPGITVVGRPSIAFSDGTIPAFDYRGRYVGAYQRLANGRASVRSAFGDASDEIPFMGGFPDAMNALDRGRTYIIANDHSLEDAIAAFDTKDYPAAFKLFKISYTKMGYPVAAAMVGKMYFYGVGTPKDIKQALIWLKKAAKFPPYRSIRTGIIQVDFSSDNAAPKDAITDAVMTMGQIYLYGIEVPQDFNEARKWFAKANSYGFAPASDILGQIYQKGYGVVADPKTAFAYFKKAAELGYGPAQYRLGLIYYAGDAATPQNPQLAREWWFQASLRGHPDALYLLARIYDLGDGVTADPQKALVYYKDAALKGQPDAQNALGTYFYEGQTVPKDLIAARKWFKQAAMQGQVDAMFNLAVMYYRSEGGNKDEGGYKDIVSAYVWFTLAKLSGHPQADAALKVIEPTLTPEDRSVIEVLLKPVLVKP